MARQKKNPSSSIKLRQPDRSGPTEKTLLDLAQERNLFEQAKKREDKQKRQSAGANGSGDGSKAGDADEEDEAVLRPGTERFLEAALWTSTLAMLHFTLDVLVQHQYGVEVKWDDIAHRTGVAWLVFFLLFHPLHPHTASPPLVPSLVPEKHQRKLRQAIFFAMSVLAGCGVIHVTNQEGYLAVMKRAPPMACLWVWAVVELDLVLAVLSLLGAGGYMWAKGYSYR